MGYWVYVLASRKRGTLYVGVTNDHARRVDEHRAWKIRLIESVYPERKNLHDGLNR